ncbi:MAG TPA: class I SAM-dependent methyltransferase [Polyangiaceae bacterium]|nr:class I SAM-dependent methyltransferase [Polyangiaceae bacterium]
MANDVCNVCGAPRAPDAERGVVRSNVRRFRNEKFGLWRCSSCRSIHAEEDVDLAHYYSGYPVFAAELDWKLNVVYGGMLARLKKGGLRPEHRILDYGCGSGMLVKFLQTKGYGNTVGWDAYAEAYKDTSVLQAKYDCVVSQDVIEHVDSPLEFLRTCNDLLVPGGIASIGTPDAAALSLQDPEEYVHTLHAPFHRHILSADALRKAGEDVGWKVLRYYSTMYNNTLFPTMNPRFVLHYVRTNDDTFDLVTEPIQAPLALFTPKTLFFALFGFFFDRHTDIQFVFQKPKEPARLPA